MSLFKSIIPILLILLSTMKVSAIAHYCHGELESINIVEAENCCGSQKKKDCCDDVQISIDNDIQLNKASLLDYTFDYYAVISPVKFEITTIQFSNANHPKQNGNKAPPLLSKQKTYLLFKKINLYQ